MYIPISSIIMYIYLHVYTDVVSQMIIDLFNVALFCESKADLFVWLLLFH